MPQFVCSIFTLCASLHWNLVAVCFLSYVHTTLAVKQALASTAEVATAAPPAECSADHWSGTFRLPSVACYSTFPAPDSSIQGGVVSNPRQLMPSSLLQVSILAPVGRSSSEELCGLDLPGQQNTFLTQARSSSGKALEVRRGVDRRWLLTSSFIDPAWYTVMAWTNASLRVLFDPSCSGSSDLRFVQQYIPAWSICRRFANGSSVQFERWNSSTLFAQDRRLAPWVMLPSDYECSDGNDYELIVSATSASTKLTVTLYTRPGNDSCRVLCIAERCDGTFLSDHLVGGNQSLSIRYKVRSAASKCDSGAYTGFALVLQVNPANVITLTTYERDSLVNALEDSSTKNSLLLVVCVTGTVAVVIIVVVSIAIARLRAVRSRRVLVGYRTPEATSSGASLNISKIQKASPLATLRKDYSREAYWHAAQNDPTRGETSPIETGRNDRGHNAYGNVTDSGRTSTAAAGSAQLLGRAIELTTCDTDADEIYAEIDDIVLSTEMPKNTICAGQTACDVHGDRFVESHSHAGSQSAAELACKPKSDKYITLRDPNDDHPYSVPM